jgi:GNAT superfamily N-acetyltransferase
MSLEDLCVLPQFRRRGFAWVLRKKIAALALEENYPSIHWLVMGWNQKAVDLHSSVGADIEPGTSFCRIHGAALEDLAT